MTGSQDWADQESFNAYVASLLQLLHSFQEYFRSCADGGCCEGGGGVGGVGGGVVVVVVVVVEVVRCCGWWFGGVSFFCWCRGVLV